jgi:homoserine dehydrogenase
VGTLEKINLGLMGLGVVGGGIANVLLQGSNSISQKIGCPVNLKKVLVRDPDKTRDVDVSRDLLTTNPEEILDDDDIHILSRS